MSRVSTFLADIRGAAAAEFAMVLPGLLFLIFGIFNLCMATYAEVSLHDAVEQAARYASVTAAANGSDANLTTLVPAYAKSHYFGPGLGTSPAFATNGACQVKASDPGYEGYKVTWSGTYKVFYGVGSVPFTLSATACFP